MKGCRVDQLATFAGSALRRHHAKVHNELPVWRRQNRRRLCHSTATYRDSGASGKNGDSVQMLKHRDKPHKQIERRERPTTEVQNSIQRSRKITQCRIRFVNTALSKEDLECVLQRELEEACIRGIVLEELWTSNLSTRTFTNTLIRWVIERGMIEYVECICTELQILFTPRREVLEDRHIHAIVSRPVDLI